jgi:hypothetical protein
VEGLDLRGRRYPGVRPEVDALPIQYRDFYDVPSLVAVEVGSRLLLLDSAFDDVKDDYDNEFVVYELPASPRSRLAERRGRT